MKETLISLETALLVKEKGFDLKSYYFYWGVGDKKLSDNIDKYLEFKNWNSSELIKDKFVTVVTQSLLQTWLREVHNIDIIVITNYKTNNAKKSYRLGIIYIKNKIIESEFIRPIDSQGEFLFVEFDFYSEALEAGLVRGLNLIN